MHRPGFIYKKLTLLSSALLVVIIAGALFYFFNHKTISVYKPKPNKVFIVIIDPGHGGKDDGTNTKTIKEKNITLAIAKQIEAIASQYGLNVILTRHTDTFMNPRARVAFAMTQNADAYVSLHVNELKGYSYVNGMQVYVSGKNPDFEQSRKLGSAIAQNLGADFKISHTLQQRAENIYVLADNSMPSALVECGFITNAADAKMLTDSTKTFEIAKQVLTGIAAYTHNSIIDEYAVKQVPTFTPATKHKVVLTSAILHTKHAKHRGSRVA